MAIYCVCYAVNYTKAVPKEYSTCVTTRLSTHTLSHSLKVVGKLEILKQYFYHIRFLSQE